jgi:hypothetical protein
MASALDGRLDHRSDTAPGGRSVGEHVFIWTAWALAAAFWSMTLAVFAGILRDTAQPVSAPAAPGAPGGMGYLGLVIAAFVVFGLALAYGSWRTARMERPDRVGDSRAP